MYGFVINSMVNLFHVEVRNSGKHTKKNSSLSMR